MARGGVAAARTRFSFLKVGGAAAARDAVAQVWRTGLCLWPARGRPLAPMSNPSRRYSRGAQSVSCEVNFDGPLRVLVDRYNAVRLCDDLAALRSSARVWARGCLATVVTTRLVAWLKATKGVPSKAAVVGLRRSTASLV